MRPRTQDVVLLSHVLSEGCREQGCNAALEADGEPFRLAGTAIVEMVKVRCAKGHWYQEVLATIDEPT